MDLVDTESEEVETESYNLIVKRSNSSDQVLLKEFAQRSLHETDSITNALEDLDFNDQNVEKSESINMSSPYSKCNLIRDDDGNYQTREKYTNNIFVISTGILNYRGRHYSLTDIAPVWKKDCRKWLWKNSNKCKIGDSNDLRKNTKYPS